jgi:hypothetical protein
MAIWNGPCAAWVTPACPEGEFRFDLDLPWGVIGPLGVVDEIEVVRLRSQLLKRAGEGRLCR